MRIKWNPERCYACGACQLACSFHLTGSFQPSQSSIKVLRNPVEGTIAWRLDDSWCDGCTGLEQPLCVKYCTYEAITCPGQARPNLSEASHG